MRFAALPPGPEWLFEEVVDSDLSTEEELEWWKWQPETYHDAVTDFASEEPVATAGRDGVGPEVNEQHRSALQNATSIQEMICEPPVIRIEPRSVSSAAPNGCEYDAANCTAAMPSIVESSSRLEEKYASKGSYHGLWTGMVVKDILAEPERQEIKLSMSRLMNVVLGILLGLLFAITGILFKN
ncbi:hypothetical protein R3P38DRAFT_3284148 [Favolaschia claudopus]|uniref:Uncharacterized protein n=1 Tax=Favolaschia claudopus TaxID=2862362 RepID=A0AAW0A5Z0_9AGAR